MITCQFKTTLRNVPRILASFGLDLTTAGTATINGLGAARRGRFHVGSCREFVFTRRHRRPAPPSRPNQRSKVRGAARDRTFGTSPKSQKRTSASDRNASDLVCLCWSTPLVRERSRIIGSSVPDSGREGLEKRRRLMEDRRN